MGPPMTEGRRALLSIGQRTTAREVAARCRVSPSRVSEWLSGRCRPSERAREALERTSGYGIPASSWDAPRRG
jgi:transcriptional regulator with XRE-family HTH domain